jgi:catechol 2,3-dioxygenase-like lactoylglutathione lyase family enzyme
MNIKSEITKGVHHIGLTVAELQPTQQFFEQTLSYELLGTRNDYPAVFLSDGFTMITLWQATDPEMARPFDRKNNIGLHHMALSVAEEKLDPLYTELSGTPDVKVEFAPELLGAGPTRHFIATVPGGIRIEFIAPVTQVS